MVFPSSWDPTRATKKRKKTFMEETDSKAAQSGVFTQHVPFQSDLQQTILRKLNCQASTQPTRAGEADQEGPPLTELNLDHILSRVPYRSMLENLFSNADEEAPEVPILTKGYEETFMRQPMAGERACAMGDQCECTMIDRTAPFIGVELRLPNDPETPQMCVLCSRATTQKCFYDICYLSKPIQGVIQRYGGIFGQPGEYAMECMLLCPRAMGLAHMPVPCMSHQRNRYSVVSHGGIKHLKQHRVSFEDFHHPSSSEQV